MSNGSDEFAGLRDEIDRIDARIVELVAERLDTIDRVANVKSLAGKNIVDTDREEDVKSRYGELFARNQLDPDDGRDIAEHPIDVAAETGRPVEGDSDGV